MRQADRDCRGQAKVLAQTNLMSDFSLGQLPQANVAFDVRLPQHNACPDPVKAIRRAVDELLVHLEGRLTPGQSVAILVDDYTRLTPTMTILSVLLPALHELGVTKDDLFFVFASGSHRAMTPREKAERLGAEVYATYRSLDHRYLDKTELVQHGVLPDGTPIWINKHVLEADAKIAVGTILPHVPAGFSGGAKMVLPGVAGEETASHMHLVGARDRTCRLGETGTQARRIMERFAAEIELSGIVNAVLNGAGQIVDVVGGDFIAAHRCGVRAAQRAYGVALPQLADIVVANAYPIDQDFPQAHKALFSAERAVKQEGEILVVARCSEGPSPTHGEMLKIGRMTNGQLERGLAEGSIKDALAVIEVMHANHVERRAQISICSPGLRPEHAKAMGYHWVEDVQEYLQARLAHDPALTIGLLHDASEILPLAPE